MVKLSLSRALMIATLIAISILSAQTHAGTPNFAVVTNSGPFAPASLVPGQVFTVTVAIKIGGTSPDPNLFPFVDFGQIELNPNPGSQFEIVGGTCRSILSDQFAYYANDSTCTVDVRYNGTLPGNHSANLRMKCGISYGGLFSGGYHITCTAGSLSTSGIMQAFFGNGIAVAVDAIGREGLTMLALMLFGIAAFFSLKRRAKA